MAISKFSLEVLWEMVLVGEELVAFQSLSTTEKCTSPFNLQSNEPFLKFLRQSFHKKRYTPQGHNLQPLPWGLWSCHPQRHKFRTFQLR